MSAAVFHEAHLLQVVELLLRTGMTNPDQVDSQGYSPAHVAAQWGPAYQGGPQPQADC